MEHYRNNPVSLASTRMRRSVAADYAGTAPLGFADSGVSARRGVREPMRAAGPSRRGNDGSQRGGSAPAGAKRTGGSSRGGRASGSGSFMKYATDNAFVRQIYGFISGPFRPLFIVLVVIAVTVGLYFPLRNYYVAWRTGDILSQQLELRTAYNDGLQEEVDQYLSQEGIEQSARSELGMVLPGETRIDVIGGDDDAKSGESEVPTTASEAEKAESTIIEDAPWYIKVLDTVFFFGGTEGETVSSTGGQ